jgi:hypothetical protein
MFSVAEALEEATQARAIDSERVSTILSKLGDGDVQEHQLRKILIESYRALPSDAKQYTKTFLSELD